MTKEIKNKLICGDNLSELGKLPKESVDLIYLDPPFFSHKQYEVVWGDEAEVRSFEDRWEGGIEHYIDWMIERVVLMYDVLKPTGSFYLHCDWHANAHLRIMLDKIFGENNFRNEIIWHYRRWTAPSRKFQRLHDNILFYTKGQTYTFNPLLTPYTKGSIDRKQQGILHRFKKGEEPVLVSNGEVQANGVPENDVWHIPFVAPSAKERLGYPTQKPEALLERIINASSNKGDLVLDPFCGCGTTVVVAQRLQRKWIGIDISPTAIKVVEQRLHNIKAKQNIDYIIIGSPTTVTQLKDLKPFEFQNWVINELRGRHSRKKVGDMGIDGYITKDLYRDHAGIQVKQSESVGRNVVDNFNAALERAKYKKGYLIGFSFTKGATEEVARLKHTDKVSIELIKVKDILEKKILLK